MPKHNHEHKEEFERIGVKVMVDDYQIVNILNHKDLAYKELAKRGVSTIPDYRIVTSVAEFEKTYSDLKRSIGKSA